MTSQLKHLSPSEIKPNPFEVRSHIDTESESFLDLVDSIKEHGIIQPVLLRKHKNSYQIVAGSRRLTASKKAREKTIPVVIRDISDTEAKILSLIENVHRENLNDMEKAQSLVKIYQSGGFTLENTLTQIRQILNESLRGKSDTSVPNDFLEIYDQITLGTRVQFELLRLAKDLSPNVLKYVEKIGLPLHKKILLTRPEIKKDPKLQRTVANMIKNMPPKAARELVHNIQEKNYKFTGKSFRIDGENGRATLKPQEFTDDARIFFTVNVGMINDLIGHFTNSYKKVYSDEMLDRTVNFRLEKIKQLKEPDLNNWYNSMVPLINILDEMKKEMDREFRTREKHREMLRR